MKVERGYVLLLVLVVVLVVMSLSAMAIRQSLTDGKLAFATGKTNSLFVMADTPLAQLNRSDVRQLMSADDGIIAKMMAWHEQNFDNQNTNDANNFHAKSKSSPQTIGVLCYHLAAGLENFHQYKLSLNPSNARCGNGQVWLWLVLTDVPQLNDFAYLPSGVDIDDIADGKNIPTLKTYHLTIYSLAVARMDSPCASHPLQVKSCLEESGISHQMLVQEYQYGY